MVAVAGVASKRTNPPGAFGAAPVDQFAAFDQAPSPPSQRFGSAGATPAHVVSTRTSSIRMPVLVAPVPTGPLWRNKKLSILFVLKSPPCEFSIDGSGTLPSGAPKVVEDGLIHICDRSFRSAPLPTSVYAPTTKCVVFTSRTAGSQMT